MDCMSRQDGNIVSMWRDNELSNVFCNLCFNSLRVLVFAKEHFLGNSLDNLEHDLPQTDFHHLVSCPFHENSLTPRFPTPPSGTPDPPNGSPSPQL